MTATFGATRISISTAAVGWIAWAMSKGLRTVDVAAEIPSEAELREPVSVVPHLKGHGPI